MSLTPDAVKLLSNGVTDIKPVVQVLDTRTISSKDGPERHRLVISDGVHYQQAILASQLTEVARGGAFPKYSIVRLDEFVRRPVSATQSLLVVLNLTKVQEPVSSGRLGNPTSIEDKSAAAAPSSVSTASASASGPSAAMYGAPATGGYGAGAAATGYGGAMGGAAPVVTPIDALNPYANRWTIKARVTSKQDVKKWSNARGEGKLFNIELLDEGGGEIRATFFKEAVDKWFDAIVEGAVYYFTGGRIKAANKKFNNLKSEYEITFDEKSGITPAGEDASIKSISYNFAKLDQMAKTELPDREPDSSGIVRKGAVVVDVLGMVTEVGGAVKINTRRGDELSKRDVTIADETGHSITLTLWGDRADLPSEQFEDAVIAIKGARLGDFGGKSLSTGQSSQIEFNPDLPEAHALRTWWTTTGSKGGEVMGLTTRGGGGGGATSWGIEARSTLSDVRAMDTDKPMERAQWVTVKATIAYIRHEKEKAPWYESCANPKPVKGADGKERQCQKKVVKDMSGYMCESCQHHSDVCNYRYIMSAKIMDDTDDYWITFFDNEAEAFLGRKASDLAAALGPDGSDESGEYERVFRQANFGEMLFRLKIATRTAMDQIRMQASVQEARPVNYASESAELLKGIKMYG